MSDFEHDEAEAMRLAASLGLADSDVPELDLVAKLVHHTRAARSSVSVSPAEARLLVGWLSVRREAITCAEAHPQFDVFHPGGHPATTEPTPLTDENLAALATYYGAAGTMEYDPEVLRIVAEVERLRGAAQWVLEQLGNNPPASIGPDLADAVAQLRKLVPPGTHRC